MTLWLWKDEYGLPNLESDRHPMKQDLSTFVTEEEMGIDLSSEHWERWNAWKSIGWSSESDSRVNTESNRQTPKQSSQIIVTDEGIQTDLSDEHSENAQATIRISFESDSSRISGVTNEIDNNLIRCAVQNIFPWLFSVLRPADRNSSIESHRRLNSHKEERKVQTQPPGLSCSIKTQWISVVRVDFCLISRDDLLAVNYKFLGDGIVIRIDEFTFLTSEDPSGAWLWWAEFSPQGWPDGNDCRFEAMSNVDVISKVKQFGFQPYS
jgi:hypothetical protein